MASPTFRATYAAVAYASAKSMIDVFNGAGSAKIIKVIRAFMFNNQTAAVTGVMTTLNVRRTTAASGGTTITPVKHDTTNANLDANTTCGTGRTITGSDIFRRIMLSTDEPAAGAGTNDEWQCVAPFAEVWSAGGDGNSAVEPITCNASQGFDVQQPGANAVGVVDVELEFINV